MTPTVFTTRNDCVPGGSYTGTTPAQYVVQIDGTGTPDTFKWSANGGSSWAASKVAITASPTAPQVLSNGVTVTFGQASGHQLGDSWAIAASPMQIAPALFNGRNDCTPGGVYRGQTASPYRVQIDNVSGPVDTFKWSADNGNTWRLNGVAISGSAQFLSNGVTVTFAHTTGHQVGDTWAFTSTPVVGTLPSGQTLKLIPLAAAATTQEYAAQAGATAINVAVTTGLTVGMNVLLHDYDPTPTTATR